MKKLGVLIGLLYYVLLMEYAGGQTTESPVSLPTVSIPAVNSIPEASAVPNITSSIPVTGVGQASGVSALVEGAAAPGGISQTPESISVAVQKTGDQAKVVIGQQTNDKNNKDKKDIYLNFDNTELNNFINYIAELKKINLIPDKSIEASKISLSIREPLSIEGAWNVFLTVLETAGFSIVQVGEVYKIIPKDKKTQQPLPVYINIPPDKLPDSDLTIRYVLFLNNIEVGDIMELLKSMLSDKSAALDIKEVRGIIITDKAYNVKSAAKLLTELDQMGTAEAVTVLRLKNVNATDVKELLGALIKKPEASPLARLLGKVSEGTNEYFPPGTRIIAEERTNSLILLGNPKPLKKIEEFIVNHIDTELKEAKSPLHVYELQYTDAAQIKDILTEVTKPGDSSAGQSAGKYGAIRGGVKYFRGMTFQVDKDGNRLIVSSTDNVDWKLLKQTIRDLDKPQPQVAIETLIVTVDVTDSKEMGGAVRNKKHGQLGTNIDFQSAALAGGPSMQYKDPSQASAPITDAVSLLGNMTSQIVTGQGLSVLTFGPGKNIWAIFRMLQSVSNTSVMSQPFLLVANKKAATVDVGSTVRVVQEVQGGDGGLKGWVDTNAKTTVKVTPQINLDGVIRLDIDTSMEEFASADYTQKTLRKLTTSVTVANGQILVLGGFVKTSVSESQVKTPILSDIPILGWLFKGQKRSINKQYVFLFMNPTIVKPRQLPGMGLYTKMKLHKATDEIEESIHTKKMPDPIHNWYFNAEKENYSHKVIDYANARYQPTTVDISNDPYYRTKPKRELEAEDKAELVSVVGEENIDKTGAGVSKEGEGQIPPSSETKETKEPGREVLVSGDSGVGPDKQEKKTEDGSTVTVTASVAPGETKPETTGGAPKLTGVLPSADVTPVSSVPVIPASVMPAQVSAPVLPIPETPPVMVPAPGPVVPMPEGPVPSAVNPELSRGIPSGSQSASAGAREVHTLESVIGLGQEPKGPPMGQTPEIDRILEEKRQKLKDLLAPAPTVTGSNVAQQESVVSKPGVEQALGGDQLIEKRNSLKDFLSRNPTFAFGKRIPARPVGRGMA